MRLYVNLSSRVYFLDVAARDCPTQVSPYTGTTPLPYPFIRDFSLRSAILQTVNACFHFVPIPYVLVLTCSLFCSACLFSPIDMHFCVQPFFLPHRLDFREMDSYCEIIITKNTCRTGITLEFGLFPWAIGNGTSNDLRERPSRISPAIKNRNCRV